jgi:hypothetical protein
MDGRRFLGRGRDLSQSGISLQLDGHLPRVGSQLDGEFQLPGIQLPLMLRARVAWTEVSSGHVGLHFEELDPGVGELLENFVAGRF